jgi:hypothetical protein
VSLYLIQDVLETSSDWLDVVVKKADIQSK